MVQAAVSLVLARAVSVVERYGNMLAEGQHMHRHGGMGLRTLSHQVHQTPGPPVACVRPKAGNSAIRKRDHLT
jgi:hypothetical protein